MGNLWGTLARVKGVKGGGYFMPMTQNDTELQGIPCPLHKTTLHYKVFHAHYTKRHCITRYPVRRIPAVSVPPNPTWLRSCPVSVCFGPETLALRPRNVEFRLSPRTNTCGLHAWAAVCHLPPGGCETVSVPKQFRYRNSSGGRNSSGAETVSVPKQFRYRNTL